jgi:protocatechuate 3,4-dioxygenase, alpha subunit
MTEAALTPSQTAGPFLRIGLFGGPITNRLVDESDDRAIKVSGVLLDGAGDPVADGMVEIWQANAAGRYAHPADDRTDAPLEQGFTGFGRSGTEGGGRFELLTAKPGRVPWVDGRLQAPHLLVSVFARGLLKRVVTRMYFPDEEGANADDPVLLGLEPDRRATLIALPADGGVHFDIVLQGDRQTTFFVV